MISIVICSVSPEQLSRVKANIQETIGLPYEIVAIDNRRNPRGITTVYNEGARKSQYEQVCFVHEDVQFNTAGWGKVLLDHFKDPELGLVGVAGATHKPKMLSGWGAQGLALRYAKMNFIQHFPASGLAPAHQYQNSENEELAQVACLDGLFLATKKSIIEEIPFDENLLKGFHGYDMDISIAIGRKYKVAVTYCILVEHFSGGSLNKEWLESALLIHRKWRHVLPVSLSAISKKEKAICEKETFRFVLNILFPHFSVKKALRVLHMGELRSLDFFTYMKMYLSIGKAYFS
ncbi:glycosyltransferase [Pleomorphovibrio marinus]|uniref:glycosyltransferase n=1 Tax=Pleomorphovibrio marinus TaxID=2164132 RepID=UPI001300979B|nr:glycosyltransferase [Pleomorphovibrio marinus]